jgi:hypothetical protein
MAARISRWNTWAGVFFLVALFSMGGLQHYYWAHMPASPDAGSGRTIAVEVSHGKTVYVDSFEHGLLIGSQVVFGLSIVAALFAWFVTQRRR